MTAIVDPSIEMVADDSILGHVVRSPETGSPMGAGGASARLITMRPSPVPRLLNFVRGGGGVRAETPPPVPADPRLRLGG